MNKYDHNRITDVLIANPLLGHRAIANLTGVSRSLVWKVARERGIRQQTVGFHRTTSATKEAEIVQLRSRGATYKVIAATTKSSLSTVSKVVRDNHLRPLNRAGRRKGLPAQGQQERITEAVKAMVSDFRENMRDAMFEAQDRAHKALKKLVRKHGLDAVRAGLEECSEIAETRVDAVLEIERELRFIVTGAL